MREDLEGLHREFDALRAATRHDLDELRVATTHDLLGLEHRLTTRLGGMLAVSVGLVAAALVRLL